MIKKESNVIIELHKDMSPHLYSSLNLLYLPLLGEQAYLFYTTLLAIKLNELSISNHQLMLRLCKMSDGAMEKARKKCEEFLLLRTYYNEEKDTYLYVLDVPMKISRFLSHEVFGKLFLNAMGKDTVAFYKSNFVNKRTNKSGYQEISATMQDTLSHNWDMEREKTFQSVKEEMEEVGYRFLNVIFDEKIFLNGLSELVFPLRERTKKNIRTIAEIATIYGINEKMMRTLIGKGMDLPEGKFNAEKLKKACMKTKAKYVNDNPDPYQLPPKRYLEYKQNGATIGMADQKLIEKLIGEYRLQPEVINVLLETGLLKDKENPRIVGTDIERMAGSWVRLKIDTLEAAKKQQQKELNPVTRYQSHRNVQQGIVQNWEKEEEKEMSQEERAALLAEIKSLGGDNNAED